MRVEEVLLVVRETPLREDRAATGDDAGDAPGGQRDVAQQHARVHGEVVDALLGLLDQRVAVQLPGQFLGTAADLLERLVDRHRADRHGAVADDPLARLVDVLARREVHHRVGAPERRPAELVDFLLDRRGDGGVADVGVDLHQEVAADDHRLQFGVIDVGRDDGAAARDLVAHEFGREALARGDVGHLRRDVTTPRVGELAHGLVAARPAPRARPCGQRRRHLSLPRLEQEMTRLLHRVATTLDPGPAQLRQPFAHVHALRPAGVVHPQRRIATRQLDLAHRHADAEGTVHQHLAGSGKRLFVGQQGCGGRCGRL